jgi:hypothetical protein
MAQAATNSKRNGVERYFIRAQQLDFPYAVKRVAGPLETLREAFAEARRIRGDFPNCNLTPYPARVAVPPAGVAS